MDPLRELTMGFGMALFANQKAAAYFAALTDEQQSFLVEQTHQIHSKQEMRAFVDHLPQKLS